ncbi:guanylate-binding protein 2-like isoform X2 [Mya arenaria]|uniref:guanylate-binding protein 2-like isoform X2 n=1 Tax=Mya arenaria TaxID=6604 RepID=UPI0022E994CF|nr:guanylate-binding protein 2-like isoform X2 [Mya arenaria]
MYTIFITDMSTHDLEVFKRPLCLISAGSKNELEVEEDTIEQLSKIDLPCVVVAIAGLYRTGKSFLMNCLADQNGGFALGDTIESKTKGIWVWCRVHPEQKNTVLVLLDTEGLGDIAKGDPTHDNKLFTLATLLSSTLVYNMKGVFDQDAVNKLTFVTELSKNITLGTRVVDEMAALQCILPGFVLVVRDFTLKLVKDGRTITADEYLEESLQDVDYEEKSKNEKCNRARASIRNYFPNSRRKCFLLPPPGDLETIENLEMLKFEDLSSRFQEQTTYFVSYIYAQPPKQLVVSKPVNGSMFVELTRTYVEAIIRGGVPDVEDAFAAVAKSENEKVKKETLDMFEVLMSKYNIPAPIKQLESQYREAEMASLAHFRKHAAFDDGNIVEKEVKTNMDIFWASIKDKNLHLIRGKCKTALETSTWAVNFKTQLERREFEVVGGYSKFRQRLQLVEIEFKRTFAGYDKHEYMVAWSEFLQSIKSKEAFIKDKDESLSEEVRQKEKQIQDEIYQARVNKMKEDAANARRAHEATLRQQQEKLNKKREEENAAREARLRKDMTDRNNDLNNMAKEQQMQIEALINRPPVVHEVVHYKRSRDCVVQ